jgi:hypothetical protein
VPYVFCEAEQTLFASFSGKRRIFLGQLAQVLERRKLLTAGDVEVLCGVGEMVVRWDRQETRRVELGLDSFNLV